MTVGKKNRLWSNILGSIFALIFLFFFLHLGYDAGSVVILAIVNVFYISVCYFLINTQARVESSESGYRWIIYAIFPIAFIVLWGELPLIANILLWASALIPVLCYPRLINLDQFLMTGLWYAAFAGKLTTLWMVLFGVILALRGVQLLTATSLGREAKKTQR